MCNKAMLTDARAVVFLRSLYPMLVLMRSTRALSHIPLALWWCVSPIESALAQTMLTSGDEETYLRALQPS